MGKPDQPRDSKGRWRPRQSALAGLVIAVVGVGALGWGPAGTSSSSSSTGGSNPNARSSSSKQVKAVDRDVARLMRRLQDRNLQVEPVAVSTDNDCVAHSYGTTRSWFADRPCSALYRVLLRATDRDRSVAMIAVAAVDMPESDDASELKSLVDGYGTGNVTELRGRGPRVDWTGRYYVSDRDDTTFVNAQAEPVGRTAKARDLANLASRAVVDG